MSHRGGACAHLFPFGTGGEKSNGSLGNTASSSDDGCMIDELVCSRLEEEQGGDECRHIVGNDLCIVHGGICFGFQSVQKEQEENLRRKPGEGILSSHDPC